MVRNLENEIWKPVKGYEGKYEVSNLGRVKSLNYSQTGEERLLKPSLTTKNGYLFVVLRKDFKSHIMLIHRIVYEAFRGKLPKFVVTMKGDERMEVNHINEIKTDNRLENLELVTSRQNNNHGTHNLRSAMSRMHKIRQCTLEGILVKEWDNINDCAKNGFYKGSVYKACEHLYSNKKTNVYKGFVWNFVPFDKGV